jgi:transcriptional regulator with XRE-family HTH domain
MSTDNGLGVYLRDRRGRLDPAALGLPGARRRTPGLRREEVAQRANISATWYTWLEQGRGGAPSADVLDRVARALVLTDAEREHLFILGLGRQPDVRYQPVEGVTPQLQRVLDGMTLSPALVKTTSWDVVAWNRAAQLVLTDYSALPPENRNIMRMMFLDPNCRAAQFDWEAVARFVVAVFRADAARAGAAEQVQPLVDELCSLSPDFREMWSNNDVRGHGEGVKRLRHPIAGMLAMEFCSFAVHGRPDLQMLVYTPASATDAELITSLIAGSKEDGPRGEADIPQLAPFAVARRA